MPKMPINKTQPQTGINIQITTLIEAMMDSEKCLFRNNDANLMKNTHPPADKENKNEHI
jgi:hypothetical protein